MELSDSVTGRLDEAKATRNELAGVQSAEVGLRLLQPLIRSTEPLSLKEISDACNFAPPKAYRYLVSFARAGLVTRLADTGRYMLGPLAAELGFAALRQIDGERFAREATTELTRELGVTSALVVWTDAGPVIVAVEPALAAGSVFISIQIGSTLQITRSASGLIFLAHMCARKRTAVLTAAAEAEQNPVDEVLARIELVKALGYAVASDQMMVGVSGLAVPIFDASGRVRFTLAAIGPTPPTQEFGKGAIRSTFKRKAAELSAKFGARAADHGEDAVALPVTGATGKLGPSDAE